MEITSDAGVDGDGLAAIHQLIDDRSCGSAVYRCETASTNTLALHEVRDQGLQTLLLPRLYLTDRQTAGRGRRGRTWCSDHQTLTFSILANLPLPADSDSTGLIPLAVGIGIAETLEFYFAPMSARLKWPNDVYFGGGKTAGVLIETCPRDLHTFVIGVGINVSGTPEISDPHAPPVSSIAGASGQPIGRYALLADLVRQIMNRVGEISSGRPEMIESFRHRCLLTGGDVQYQHQGQTRSGRCQGVDDQGRLQIDRSGQVEAIQSGEVTQVRAKTAH